MNNIYDVLIIGGGVNSCSIAYQLTKKGYRTAILEKTRIGAGASSAAAGMLGAQVEIKEKGPFFDFARTSRNMYPELVPELEEKSGVAVSFVKNGMLKVACNEAERDHLLEMQEFQRLEGEHVEWLEPEEAKRKEPGISGDIYGALYIPDDGQVKAQELTFAYAGAAKLSGAEIHEFTAVTSILKKNGKVTGVSTPIGSFYAEHVILASGAWSGMIPEVEDYLSMIPIKGECLSLRPEKPVFTSTIHAADFYLVPKPGGSVILGATEHEGVMDRRVTVGAVRDLLYKAVDLFPALHTAEWEKAWTGVRPQTVDGMPFLGAGHLDGLWIATGHYRNGILLSALTGSYMADLIDGAAVNEEWKKAFSPLRLKKRKEDPVEINH